MLKSDRLQLIVIAGLVFAVIALSIFGWAKLSEYKLEHAEQRQKATTHKPEQAREQRQATCVDAAKKHSFPCVVDTEKSADEEKYTEYDLRAQQEMAEWAFGMMYVSGLAVLVTLAATVYVALTLAETRKLARDSKSSSDATALMAKAAIGVELPIVQASWGRTDVVQTREMVIENGPYGGTVLDRPYVIKYIAIGDFFFRNFGKTIAIPHRLRVGFMFARELPPEPAFISEHAFDAGAIISPEPQSNAFRANYVIGISISEDSAQKWVKDEVFLWLYSELTYSDFLGEMRTKRFCVRWADRPAGSGMYHFASDWNPPESYTA